MWNAECRTSRASPCHEATATSRNSAFHIPHSAFASQVVSPERQGHTTRSPAAAHQLAALDRDHPPIPFLQPFLAGEQVHGGDDAIPAVLQLAQGGFVAG